MIDVRAGCVQLGVFVVEPRHLYQFYPLFCFEGKESVTTSVKKNLGFTATLADINEDVLAWGAIFKS
ncbi:MAG: hypothetical protein ACU84J_05540 [Gammaproteobacteria bacterium]